MKLSEEKFMKLSEENKIIQSKDLHYFIKQKGCEFVTIVDLGYNDGSFEKSISRIFDNYTGYCVDADKQFSSIGDNLHFDNFLMSNQSFKEEKFYLNANNSGSSSKYFISDEKNYCLVQTITLKDYYNYKKIDKVDILKIDIEGAEFDILDSNTINFLSKNTKQICVEFHDFLVRDNRYKIRLKEIFKTFKSNKFYIQKFSPDNTSVLFVNKNFINLSIKERININLFKYSNRIKKVLKRNFYN